MRNLMFLIMAVCIFSMLKFTFMSPLNADDVIDAIVGEASNQSEDTMVCISQAIRHRGNLKGVYGRHAKHNGYESADTWELAEQAWDESAYLKDNVNGAKNFGSIEDFNSGKIRLKDIKASCGDFIFY